MMKDIRLLAIILSTIPTVWLTSFLFSLLIGTVKFGHIPTYGADHDLHNIVLNSLNVIRLTSGFIGFIVVPAWLLLTIHLIINKVKFSKVELLYHLTALFSLTMFVIFKFVWTSQFLWVND